MIYLRKIIVLFVLTIISFSVFAGSSKKLKKIQIISSESEIYEISRRAENNLQEREANIRNEKLRELSILNKGFITGDIGIVD